MAQVQSSCGCACNNNTPLKLIYACSGVADVGELSDQVARKLSKNGVGKMSCLAGIGGRVSGLLKSAEAASEILIMDGCKLNCALKTMQEAGFKNIKHLCLDDLGFKKGSTEVNDDNIGKVVQQATTIL
jgi:uncharacterized metal-binding protein